MDGTIAADVALQTLRGDVINIVLGTVFLAVGATACAIAAIRWHTGVRILVWWGIFSGIFGLQKLGQTATILTVLPHSLIAVAPYVHTAVKYLLLVSALFAWRELTLGKLKLLTQLAIFLGSAIALVGVGTFVLGGPADKWMFYNNLLAVVVMLGLLAVVLVPKFSRFLVILNHRVLATGTLIYASEVLYTNLGTVLHYSVLPLVDSLGFAVFLFSLAGCGKTRFEADAVPRNALVSTARPDKKKACAEETSNSWTCSATSAPSSEFRTITPCALFVS